MEVIVDFIDANRDELGVEPICRDLQVAPSTYYAAKKRPPSARALRDAVMLPILLALWKANYSVYGAHKLWKAARRAGHDIGRDQVARLMRQAGIRGIKRGRRIITTKRDDSAPTVAGPGQAQLHRNGAQPALGDGPDLRADLVRRRLRLLHRRRVQPHDRRLRMSTPIGPTVAIRFGPTPKAQFRFGHGWPVPRFRSL